MCIVCERKHVSILVERVDGYECGNGRRLNGQSSLSMYTTIRTRLEKLDIVELHHLQHPSLCTTLPYTAGENSGYSIFCGSKASKEGREMI